ncbi:DUF433 domain-containing protein [Mesorhizobium sp.]|uniref:DUF433 domain-containing protein n=1 Tax=Mesorhizobium sp. TaxID=1871066 RepID=UPI000FE6295B|nr:DUF433 domain-containing protein [Mesorhizobium sp.]RWM28481.1 MAG: DUF433 domain-containing protein [Mesorhizobium sp.]
MSKKAEIVIAAFTEEEAARLTGLSVRQLRHWDRTDFFAPSLGNENRKLAYARLYSFKDLVALRVLDELRNESRVSMQHLREVKDKLLALGEHWSSTTLYVLKKKVVFVNAETQQHEEIVSGQGVLQIPLKIVAGDMQERVRLWRQRDASAAGRIERRRGFGTTSVVAGTRIPVENIKAFAESGYSIEQIMREYPTLTRSDVEAALAFDSAA